MNSSIKSSANTALTDCYHATSLVIFCWCVNCAILCSL